MSRALLLSAAAAALVLPPAAVAGDWPQWGENPQHQGSVSVAGQRLAAILADFVSDPFVEMLPNSAQTRHARLIA